MPAETLSDDEIDVTPTRALFVEMLTRDIALNRAVLDLVDNSVDGAKRIRQGTESRFDGLEVKVRMSSEGFEISDNCGGIGIDIAKRYAFRFGRAAGMRATPGSVGQFGVGMKRALFKFGHVFEVVSATRSDSFELKVDVDSWEQEEGPWRFVFDSTEVDLDTPESETGTTIKVTNLRSDTAAQFGSPNFRNGVMREIASTQQNYIDRGLRIVVNGTSLLATTWQLANGGGVQPTVIEEDMEFPNRGIVKRRIYAGIANSSPQAAGWYVFCNGRMILEADQTKTTGWERGDDEGSVSIPKFHGQFARFRGYVFFDSEDASLLPWNTTKTGVDIDTDLWRNTYQALRFAMRPVLDFLNRLATDDEATEGLGELGAIVRRAPAVALRNLPQHSTFSVPRPAGPPTPRGPVLTSIQFRRPVQKVEALKGALDASTNSGLGERLFDDAYLKHVGS